MLYELWLTEILDDIKYKPNFSFRHYWDSSGSDCWIQVVIVEENEVYTCRKWRVSRYMTESEVVQTAFLAIKTAEEHETREKFTYKGHAIFQPHRSIDAMIEASKSMEVRSVL